MNATEIDKLRNCHRRATINRVRTQSKWGGTVGVVPTPGTLGGPCKDDCAHALCALQREIAEAPCVMCQKLIGHNTGFLWETEAAWIHDDCLYAAPEPGEFEPAS